MTGHTNRTRWTIASYCRWLALGGVVALAGGLAGTGCGPKPTEPHAPGLPSLPAPADPVLSGPAYFEDVTASSGVDFTYKNGEEVPHLAILESLGGGLAPLIRRRVTLTTGAAGSGTVLVGRANARQPAKPEAGVIAARTAAPLNHLRDLSDAPGLISDMTSSNPRVPILNVGRARRGGARQRDFLPG